MTGEEEMDAWFTMRIDEPNRYRTELIVLRPASHICVQMQLSIKIDEVCELLITKQLNQHKKYIIKNIMFVINNFMHMRIKKIILLCIIGIP